jgi:hypothetical protein
MTSKTVLPAAAFAFTLLASPVAAHEFWIGNSGYKSPRGEHCCGQNDCHMMRAESVSITASGYLLVDGQVVPYAETLTSEDGEYWMCKRLDGSRRCFFAPQPSS